MAGFLHRLYKFVLEKHWPSVKDSFSSGRSDSRFMPRIGNSEAAEAGEIYVDEKGRVKARGSAPDDMLHVERASPASPTMSRFASLDGTVDREKQRSGIASIPAEANMVETVLQHPGASPFNMRPISDEDYEVVFEARKK